MARVAWWTKRDAMCTRVRVQSTHALTKKNSSN
jgi:hypothetical protein